MPVTMDEPADFDRALAAFRDTVERRYAERFAHNFPMMYWHRSQAELEALMEKALARGRAITDAEIWAAQGMNSPPPDAVI